MRTLVNFNHLECFLVAAKNLSFSKTAQELNIAQPVVSNQILALEKMLGAQLFYRSRKTMTLTQLGQQLYSKVATNFQQICIDINDLINKKDEVTGALKIGMLTEVGEKVFLPIISKLKQSHPKLDLRINYLKSFEIVEKIKNGDLQIGVISQNINQENIKSFEVLQEEIILVTNTPNAHKRITSIDELPFVAYRENDPLLELYFNKFSSKKRKKQINIQITVNSHKSIIELLKDHPFYAVLPRASVASELHKKQLSQIGKNTLINKLFLVQHHLNFNDNNVEIVKRALLSIKS